MQIKELKIISQYNRMAFKPELIRSLITAIAYNFLNKLRRKKN